MIDDGTGLFTIGELARSTGLTVRTIRYWSDEGVLTPVTRSAGGYRLYDAGSAARLELIRTLRELGLGLDDVRKVLAGDRTVAEVAAAHVVALDARISTLKVTRAVLSSVARRGSTAEEMTLMNKLARLSAAERRRIMEEFVEEMFHGLDLVDPDVRERMRNTAVNLPDDPTPEHVDAWVELAEMVQDPEFRAQMRRAAEFNHADRGPAHPPGRPCGSPSGSWNSWAGPGRRGSRPSRRRPTRCCGNCSGMPTGPPSSSASRRATMSVSPAGANCSAS